MSRFDIAIVLFFGFCVGNIFQIAIRDTPATAMKEAKSLAEKDGYGYDRHCYFMGWNAGVQYANDRADHAFTPHEWGIAVMDSACNADFVSDSTSFSDRMAESPSARGVVR